MPHDDDQGEDAFMGCVALVLIALLVYGLATGGKGGWPW